MDIRFIAWAGYSLDDNPDINMLKPSIVCEKSVKEPEVSISTLKPSVIFEDAE